MRILETKKKKFYKDLEDILKDRSQKNISNIDKAVKNIIISIKNGGDKSLFKYSKQFDKYDLNKSNIVISEKNRKSYKDKIDKNILKSFKIAIKNIKIFHEKQKPKNYKIKKRGVNLSSVWKPIEAVGLYIPGGNAIYPSSLIMNTIPAKVAGVKRIVLATPPNKGEINPYILAIADELNISEIYQIGGAQAIAALAYGTESIEPVNKIFGPGNSYVTSAKKQVFGKVGIDLIAGPSEIVVVADKDNNPEWISADLIAQAEHDKKAQSILITDSLDLARKVKNNNIRLLNKLPKKNIIKKSLEDFGIIIITDNLEESYKIIDFIGPEHLHIHSKNKYSLHKKVSNAGAIFLGEYSVESFGDYIIGTNHVLPTSGSSKFSSGLGVLDFMKRTSIIDMNTIGFQEFKNDVIKMAEVENLDGHKLSIKIRQNTKNKYKY